jgi:hypothetical protein
MYSTLLMGACAGSVQRTSPSRMCTKKALPWPLASCMYPSSSLSISCSFLLLLLLLQLLLLFFFFLFFYSLPLASLLSDRDSTRECEIAVGGRGSRTQAPAHVALSDGEIKLVDMLCARFTAKKYTSSVPK